MSPTTKYATRPGNLPTIWRNFLNRNTPHPGKQLPGRRRRHRPRHSASQINSNIACRGVTAPAVTGLWTRPTPSGVTSHNGSRQSTTAAHHLRTSHGLSRNLAPRASMAASPAPREPTFSNYVVSTRAVSHTRATQSTTLTASAVRHQPGGPLTQRAPATPPQRARHRRFYSVHSVTAAAVKRPARYCARKPTPGANPHGAPRRA